jgi:hypothetical protein
MATLAEQEHLDMAAHYLLSQVASDVKSKAPTVRTTVSPGATWITALSVVSQSLEPTNREMLIFPQRTRERQAALKKMILSERPLSSTNIPPKSSSASDRLPIRTPFPKDLIPPRATPKMRERLRQLAREQMEFADREPYTLKISAGITEKVLPAVPGTLRLCGIDQDPEDKTLECELVQDEMLWDSGSHSCTITKDVLPQWFLDYLAKDEHDPYRDATGTKVQVDGYIALTNYKFFFNSVFSVVPASVVPNGRRGVILGQNGFLNRMVLTTTPRIILEHRGEKVEENVWGDIHISEWISLFGERNQF